MQTQSVSDLIGNIKQTLEGQYRSVTVEGEVSNLTSSAAGHWYFSLSDESSSISVALFKMDAFRNPFIKSVKNGDKVLLTGPISVYQKKGTFQLLAKKILPAGKGNLVRRYELLKEKLTVEGLFDISLKREIPSFPKRVGVITAMGGAALQDFLNVIKRRHFWGEIIVIPAVVQGDNSAKSLRIALQKAMQTELLDCIVFTRGGGAIEDLWSFNDEGLVRDIFECPIPVISAVGHQVDFTLCDYVADKRLETPTAAAEILSSAHKELEGRMSFIGHKLKNLLYKQHTEIEKRVKRISPINVLHIIKQKLHDSSVRFRSLNFVERSRELVGLHEKEQYLDELLNNAINNTTSKLKEYRSRMEIIESKLTALDPNKVLSRGYSLLEDNDNNVITNLEKFIKIKDNTPLKIKFHDGEGVVKK
jgi:exodeoxyribonuclease VII large subunit